MNRLTAIRKGKDAYTERLIVSSLLVIIAVLQGSYAAAVLTNVQSINLGRNGVKRVTNSEKKSYLQDYKWLSVRIEEIEQELAKPINHDDVQYKGEKAEKDAVKHISKEERLQAERTGLLKKKRKIEDAISKLQNNREYILISRIYIKGMKVADVIAEMDISVRTYYRILKSALAHLEV